jgi:hypothetical protein
MRLPTRRYSLLLALASMATAMAGDVAVRAQTPQISKPKPAPPGPSTLPPLPPAAIDNTLLIGGDDIDARMVRTRMTVEVKVNGRGPYRFLVDSGADTSVVGLRIARELQLPMGTPAILNSITARSVVDRVKVAELSLGQSTIRDLEVPALKEGDLGGEGMVGIDALVHQRLMMDFETQVIKVEDARLPAIEMDGEIVVRARRQRGQLILTEVVAARLPIEAVIDTGSEVTIGNIALRDRLIRGGAKKKLFTVAATGVTGVTVDLEMARIGELKLGSVTLRNVPIAFADVPPFRVFGLAEEPAILIGTDLLETFRRVSLDFRARKVRFQLRKCGSTGIAITTSPTSSLSRLSTNDEAVCRR